MSASSRVTRSTSAGSAVVVARASTGTTSSATLPRRLHSATVTRGVCPIRLSLPVPAGVNTASASPSGTTQTGVGTPSPVRRKVVSWMKSLAPRARVEAGMAPTYADDGCAVAVVRLADGGCRRCRPGDRVSRAGPRAGPRGGGARASRGSGRWRGRRRRRPRRRDRAGASSSARVAQAGWKRTVRPASASSRARPDAGPSTSAVTAASAVALPRLGATTASDRCSSSRVGQSVRPVSRRAQCTAWTAASSW